MNEKTQQAANDKGGNYHINLDAVPNTIRQGVSEHLGQDAVLHSSKTDGSYRGTVVHMDEKYLVQAIGKDRSSAIIHDAESVEIMGATLKTRAANKDMEGRNVQIHYKGDSGKAYPWDPQKEQRQKAEQRSEKNADKMMKSAEAYAKDNIKNKSQRDAFLKHLGNVVEQTYNTSSHRQQDAHDLAKGKTATKVVSKSKQAEAGIER